MFDHVTIRVSDLEASERFYDTVLATLGLTGERPGFRLLQASTPERVTRNLHLGFTAPSRAEVDEFWRAGTEAGHPDDGAPGPRPVYSPDYYGSFLLDPDGNSAEAVHHENMRRGGPVDHIWIRVADLAASRRFYDSMAERIGFELAAERDDYARYAGSGATFSVMPGEQPTAHVHMAFPATADGVHLDPDGNSIELVYAPRPT